MTTDQYAEADLVYARARMDLREAKKERDRLALKLARIWCYGGPLGQERTLFKRAELRVKACERTLDEAAARCDALRVGRRA